MPNVIVRSQARPDREHVDQLAEFGVATVHEAMGRRGLLASELRPIYPGARIAGRAVTVLAQPGDNLMIHAAIELCEPGDVICVAFFSPTTDGAFGELLASNLRAHGVIAAVLDCGVRDVADLTRMGFPVWSRAISAQGTVKATPGSVNVPIVLGGTVVRPGDVVVADDDGVVVVALEEAAATAAAAAAREADEATKRELLVKGELSLDVYGLRARLEALGVSYVDDPNAG
jgi:4-hydroxy-4-methyl-2-oxoglutarate aldolase